MRCRRFTVLPIRLLTYKYSVAAGVPDPVFAGSLARAPGENVGIYAINLGTLTAGSNYTIDFTGANFTITPYLLSVTANALSKTYGATEPVLTYGHGALVNGGPRIGIQPASWSGPWAPTSAFMPLARAR